jgi:hypothetical protein
MQSLAELRQHEISMDGGAFVRLAKLYGGERGNISNALAAAQRTRSPERVTEVLKSVVPAGSIAIGSPSPWGSELAGFKPMLDGFIALLRGRSVFFRLFDDRAFARVPMHSAFALQTSDATGHIVGSGKAKPVSKMDFRAAAIEPAKAVAMIVVSEELLRDTSAASEAAFGTALRGAVADVVDRQFLDVIGQGISPQAATATPTDDLKTLLDIVNTTGSGRLYWLMQPILANTMSTLVALNGNRLFGDMTPSGGTLCGLPALVSAQVPAAAGSPATDSLWLIDASGIAADTEQIQLRMSRQAMIEMADDPAGDATTGEGLSNTALVSLWQQKMVALMAEVYFAAHRLRRAAVGVLEGISW